MILLPDLLPPASVLTFCCLSSHSYWPNCSVLVKWTQRSLTVVSGELGLKGRHKWRKPALKDLRGCAICFNLPVISSLLLRLPWQNTAAQAVLANLVSGERSLKSPLVRTLILLDQGPTHMTSINLNRGKTSCNRGMSREGRLRNSVDLSCGRGNNIWGSSNSDEGRPGGMKLQRRKKDEAGMACQDQEVTHLLTISGILPVMALSQVLPSPDPHMLNYIHTSTLSGLKV